MIETEGRSRNEKLIRNAFGELMKDVCTSIPGHVLTFDPLTQRAQVQIGILRVDVNDATFTIPPIVEVPVHFPGGDYAIEYQIDEGCEGDILFSQRCIDGWVQSGDRPLFPGREIHDV